MKGFFLISGVVLIISGVLQALVRPRGEAGDRAAGSKLVSLLLSRATLRAVVFVAAGALAVAAGTGYLPLPLPPVPPR